MDLSSLTAPLIILAAVTASPVPGTTFGDGHEDHDRLEHGADIEGGVVSIDLRLRIPGEPGRPATGPSGVPGPAQPEGSWIRVSDLTAVAGTPCVTSATEFLAGVDETTARRIEQDRENRFIAEYEAHISTGNPPPAPCPAANPGLPGLDPTAAQAFADSAQELLPVARPWISGSYAITGLRSWLDLGRPAGLRVEAPLDLGPYTRTGVLTATATSVVAWGDGTITTYTGPGGGYHDGEPHPDDIVHTYTDAVPSNTLTVTDTWDILVTVPGLDDIALTWTAPARDLVFPVREVRSVRDR